MQHISKSPASFKFGKCRSDWSESCVNIQKSLVAHCSKTNHNHPLIGCVRIQKEQKESQDSAVFHLGKGFEGMHEHWIARHHFPLGLMQCDGNKAIAVAKDDDANVELPQLPGKD